MMRAKVLIIEDDAALAEVLAYNLKQAGYEVFVARDGADGLQQAQMRGPDLVVLDLMLPLVDGLEVCRRLRADSSMARRMAASSSDVPSTMCVTVMCVKTRGCSSRCWPTASTR